MKKLAYWLFALCIAISSLGCQQVIDVQVANSTPQLVIEGNLTNVKGTQTVTLTNSVPYSSSNVFPKVSGAAVTITDGGTGIAYKLTESQPGVYTIGNFQGKALNTYILDVNLSGTIYEATSAMPAQVNLDSLSVIGQTFGSKVVKSVAVNFKDPAGVANQYKFVMYINGVQEQRIFAANDKLSDGRNVSDVLYEQDIVLKTGDIVNVDMQCIDAPIFNYWYALSSQGGNTPADSATPSNPTSNFNNGALGYFSAHTIQRKTIVIP